MNDEPNTFAAGIEAAAKLAERWKSSLRPGNSERLAGHEEAARDIAAAIRQLSPPVPRQHVWFKCEQPCEKQHCPYCEGGLAFCTICKKAECELEPTCPGPPVPEAPHEIVGVLEKLRQIKLAYDDLSRKVHTPGLPLPDYYDEFLALGEAIPLLCEIDALSTLQAKADTKTSDAPSPEAATIRWEGTEEQQHTERMKACVARRKQWGEDECDMKDGSCEECSFDMAVALQVRPETSDASREERLGYERRILAAERAEVRAKQMLAQLHRAAGDLVVGISIWNRLAPDAPKRSEPFEGPVVSQFYDAVNKAGCFLHPDNGEEAALSPAIPPQIVSEAMIHAAKAVLFERKIVDTFSVKAAIEAALTAARAVSEREG